LEEAIDLSRDRQILDLTVLVRKQDGLGEDGRLFKMDLKMCGMSGSCEHGNGHLGSIKVGGYNDELNNYQLLKEGSAYCKYRKNLSWPNSF
jgi:hypothetical protein